MKLAELLANPKYGKVIMRKILLIITFTILLIFGLFNIGIPKSVLYTVDTISGLF